MEEVKDEKTKAFVNHMMLQEMRVREPSEEAMRQGEYAHRPPATLYTTRDLSLQA